MYISHDALQHEREYIIMAIMNSMLVISFSAIYDRIYYFFYDLLYICKNNYPYKGTGKNIPILGSVLFIQHVKNT
jgi:hypothetical protein